MQKNQAPMKFAFLSIKAYSKIGYPIFSQRFLLVKRTIIADFYINKNMLYFLSTVKSSL